MFIVIYELIYVLLHENLLAVDDVQATLRLTEALALQIVDGLSGRTLCHGQLVNARGIIGRGAMPRDEVEVGIVRGTVGSGYLVGDGRGQGIVEAVAIAESGGIVLAVDSRDTLEAYGTLLVLELVNHA